jgi:hypothetical protein
MMRRLLSALASLALLAPASLTAQSLLNAAGLGLPSDPLDARTRALGGVGLGLQGAALLISDPAAAAGFLLPSVMITAQPSWVDIGSTGTGTPGTFRGTRFPSLGLAYPAPKVGVVTLSFESVFDQRYEADRDVTLDLGDGPVAVTDHFTSTGGVSQVRFGVARVVGRRIALGLSAGRYTGSVVRRLVRDFPEDQTAEPVESYQVGGLWTYSGNSVTGGASVSVGSFAQVAGSFTWSSKLDASPSDDTEGAAGSFDLPLQLRVGATAVLAPGLALSAGFTSADWSGIDNDLADGTSVGSTTSYGVGIELARARLLGRSAPLRFGYRKRDLPFVLNAGGNPTETVWAGGLGLTLSQAGDFVRAAVDLSVERGTREDALMSESFWRGTVSVRVSGF